jgi:hypothetical protein
MYLRARHTCLDILALDGPCRMAHQHYGLPAIKTGAGVAGPVRATFSETRNGDARRLPEGRGGFPSAARRAFPKRQLSAVFG